MFNLENCPNLYNLLTLPNITGKPILVEDEEAGETYDITHIILAAREELNEELKKA